MRGWVRGHHCVVFVSFAGRACAAVLGAMLKLVVDGVADVFHVLGRNVGRGLCREGSVVVFEKVWEFLSDLVGGGKFSWAFQDTHCCCEFVVFEMLEYLGNVLLGSLLGLLLVWLCLLLVVCASSAFAVLLWWAQ